MTKGKNKITNILLGISIAILLFGSGFKLGELNVLGSKVERRTFNFINLDPQRAEKENIDFDLFWQILDKLEEKYVDKKKIEPQKLFYGALKGMVSSLNDPYTFFLTPEDNKQSKDDLGGRFEGIGAQLGLKNNRIIIIAPIKNSPAEKVGVRAGDYVTKVNGQSTKDWTLPQTVSKIRGKKGTKVTLTLLRTDKEFDVIITRNQITVNSVELSYEKPVNCKSNCLQYAVLKVVQFGENTNTEWDRAVADVQTKWNDKQIRGLVVDLRDNPGGFLDSAVYLSSEFLPQGSLVVKQESTTAPTREYLVSRSGKLLDIPVVILINQGSASASEIFAGALRDHKRTTLVGVKSFGKGSVQEAVDLKGGAGIHVTVAKWILPNGEWINAKGITPKIVVENKLDEGNTLTKENDQQLKRAIEELVK